MRTTHISASDYLSSSDGGSLPKGIHKAGYPGVACIDGFHVAFFFGV